MADSFATLVKKRGFQASTAVSEALLLRKAAHVLMLTEHTESPLKKRGAP